MTFQAYVRPAVADIEEQQILAVVKLAIDDPDVIPLWYGETDVPTPGPICEPAIDALRAGQSFYTHKQGIPELREAIAGYLHTVNAANLSPERISLTTSAMGAIMLTLQCTVEVGDNVIVVCPEWPNAQSAVRAVGGIPRFCPLERTGNAGWTLDMAKLRSLCDARTRAIFVNSPNNPTGWVMPDEEIAALVAFARESNIWIIADEVYNRLVYEGVAAPSFLAHITDDDPVIVINSFSKTWAMTGWRVGWMVHPLALTDIVGNLIEFNYSCVPEFLQRGALFAITEGEDVVAEMVAYCRQGRDITMDRLPGMALVSGLAPPEAGFFAYFRVEGSAGKTLEIAQELVRQYKVGIAPGTAFGPGSEDWFRLCFAVKPDTLREGLDRLDKGLAALQRGELI